MIRNEREYRVTRAQLGRLESALAELRRSVSPDDEWFDVKIAAIEGQADDLRAELAEYETLRSGQLDTFKASSLDDLADLFIKARIARGWTQRDLAERLRVAEQQIQQYEATRYASASLARLTDIAKVLSVDIEETIRLRPLGA